MQPKLDATISKLRNLRCPNTPPPPSYGAWRYVNDTQSSALAKTNQYIPVNTNRSIIVPAGHDVRNIQIGTPQPPPSSASSSAQTITSAALKCETLKELNLTSYVGDRINFSPVLLEHYGTTTIYAFSFSCMRNVGLVYVFEHIPGLPVRPATIIKGDYFGTQRGSLSFFLSRPRWVDITMFLAKQKPTYARSRCLGSSHSE